MRPAYEVTRGTGRRRFAVSALTLNPLPEGPRSAQCASAAGCARTALKLPPTAHQRAVSWVEHTCRADLDFVKWTFEVHRRVSLEEVHTLVFHAGQRISCSRCSVHKSPSARSSRMTANSAVARTLPRSWRLRSALSRSNESMVFSIAVRDMFAVLDALVVAQFPK